MSQGTIVAIFVGPEKAEPMHSVGSATVEVGRGLVGDRYCAKETQADSSGPRDREVTLIEAEAVEAVERDENIGLEAAETRRNLVTRGVALNHLVGKKFRVGGVVLRGVRLCEPCKHLEKITRPGVLQALLHRGGLRAEIVEGGEVKVHDPVDFVR